MRIAQINATCGSGSTGKICVAVSKLLNEKGIENVIMYSQGYSDYSNGIKYSNEAYKKLQALKSRVFGNWGFNSHIATVNLINELEKFRPDVIHLHNIHAHDCDLNMLFMYIKKKNIKVFWTFHDCWAFTGYCTHFMLSNCNKWENTCRSCPKRKEFSWLLDRSTILHNKKRALYQDINLTIITPSQWLADVVKKSFLKNKECRVINNGINLDVFRPVDSQKSSYYADKFVILGVSSVWNYSKGLDIFCELANILDEKKFTIILVGTDDSVDKNLPHNIISIHRTQNQDELARLYSSADLFLNPTREDTYPTVNLESIACGTPVLSFNTGGSTESIISPSEMTIQSNTINETVKKIMWFYNRKINLFQQCVNKSKEFDENMCFKKYLDLYDAGSDGER